MDWPIDIFINYIGPVIYYKMKVILCTNSDLGIENTIGYRTTPISELLEKENNLKYVICRDYNKNLKISPKLVKNVIPFGNIVPKILTAIPIYIWSKFPSRNIQIKLFETFAIKHIKSCDILHIWEYSENISKEAKKKKIKIVQDVPIGLEKRNENEWCNQINALNLANIVIAPSEYVKTTLIKAGINKNKIKVIPFGVDTKRFVASKDKNKIFRIAFAGNLNYRKGINYLIQAWKELNLKDAELILYGRIYPEIRHLLSDAKKYNIKTPGFVDVSKELNKASIYVFPSLNEGSAKSVYEALACGLPVITTFNSGSIINDKKQGFIIPIKDVRAIKEKILYFYNNREKIKEFGKRARKLAEKYTWENYARKIVKVYHDIEK